MSIYLAVGAEDLLGSYLVVISRFAGEIYGYLRCIAYQSGQYILK